MRSQQEPVSVTLHKLRSGTGDLNDLEVPTIATATETGFGPVRVALGTRQEARLLLPIGTREREPERQISDALNIDVVVYSVGGQSSRFIELTCLDPRLEPIFAEIIDEIRRRISQGQTSSQACESTIEDYRSLLAAPRSDITQEVVAGLIAELLLLEQLLDIAPHAWRAWRGPLKDRHDFRASNSAIEVKAGLRRNSGTVQISSLEQLVPPEGGDLHLRQVQLENTSAGEIRLSDLVRRCCAKASSRLEVRKLLAEMGCTDPDDPNWNGSTFNLEATRTYRVVTGFPRIVPDCFIGQSVPLGVLAIKYSIDLNRASPFLLSTDEELALLMRIVDCLEPV